MNRNLIWKFVLILGIVVVCAAEVYPPGKKLKRGIDLAGGSSVTLQIDTTGLSEWQARTVSQDMIRVLRQRIDPSNKRNLIWRPQGNDRIEIQMPLPTEETRALQEAWQAKRKVLLRNNVDMRRVRHALVHRAGLTVEQYQAERTEVFTQLAGEGEEAAKRLELLEGLGKAHDALGEAEKERDAAVVLKNEAKDALSEMMDDAVLELVDDLALIWDKMEPETRDERVAALAGDDEQKKARVLAYIEARQALRDKRKPLTDEGGLQEEMDQEWKDVRELNIEIERLEAILESRQRSKELTALRGQYPKMAGAIDEAIEAYDAYAKVAGRLDDVEDLKRLLRGAGVLEFRILPIIGSDALTDSDIQRYQERLAQYGPNPKKSGDERYAWREIKSPRDFESGGAVRAKFAGREYVLASNQADEVLLHEKGPDVWKLQNARVGTDNYGAWAVFFGFNEIGAGEFWELTKTNLQEPLAILLDDQVISAPNIQSAIRASGQITGNFSGQEVQDLVDKLNAGSLPARLSDQPVSETTIGPTLGNDNLIAGLEAGKWGLIVVAVFMFVYYLKAGVLANIALFLNLVIILGVMAVTRATFTMPGIAGLILTIGMAVDANVLIFERIREEQNRGSSLAMAIRNGYGRALRTIMDANVTTFITALILYMLASEEVKGFAIILMIGIVSSMFTALFVTRAVFDLLVSRRILTKNLTMLRLIRKPDVNWMGARTLFWAISIVLVVGGWLVFTQASDKYSIEFTGGTSIHILLNDEGKDMDRADVEAATSEQGKAMGSSAIEAARVQRVGPEENREFEIVTTATNLVKISLTVPAEKGLTAAQIAETVAKAADALGDSRMEETGVEAGATTGEFVLETGQANTNKVRRVLDKALEELEVGKEATYSVESQDIVNEAVRTALAGKLDVQEDLQPREVVATPITYELVSEKPYLTDYLGGVHLSCRFGGGQTEEMARLVKRFESARLTSEFEQYGDNQYELFPPGDKRTGDDTALVGVESAVVSPDVAYGDESAEQWDGFVKNETERFTAALSRKTSLPQVTQIDASVGQKSMTSAQVAIVISLLAIVAYIWMRFGNVRFGVAAVVALIHDVSIAMGMVAASAWLAQTAVGKALLISDFKIDLPMIAAFLTVIGYSLNDTIVLFDRVRENRGKLAVLSPQIINTSINQTLSRTILTSVTTLLVLVVMYIWGGPGLRGFNYVMIIGVLVGTYSSIGIATPLLFGARVGAKKPTDNT